MRKKFEPGDICIASKDIVVDGEVAFREGDQVLIEQVSPHPERTERKYVVFSETLDRKVHLDDASLGRANETELKNAAFSVPLIIVGILLLVLLAGPVFKIIGGVLAGLGLLVLTVSLVRIALLRTKERKLRL